MKSVQSLYFNLDEPWLNSWQGTEIFLFAKLSTLDQGPIQPPTQ
jgi:hypothetical protein